MPPVQDEILSLLRRVTRQDGSLDGSTVRDGLIKVDGSFPLKKSDTSLTILWTRQPTRSRALSTCPSSLAEDLLDWLERAAEEVLAEVLEAGTGEGGVEGEGGVQVDALEERVDFDGGLGGGAEGAYGALEGSAETTEGTGVG